MGLKRLASKISLINSGYVCAHQHQHQPLQDNDNWWETKSDWCNQVFESDGTGSHQCNKTSNGSCVKSTECIDNGIRLNNFNNWNELGRDQPDVDCQTGSYADLHYPHFINTKNWNMVKDSEGQCTQSSCNYCCGVTVGEPIGNGYHTGMYGPHCRNWQCGTGHFASSMIDMNIDPTNNWAKCQSK
jgi:hypothetical protein